MTISRPCLGCGHLIPSGSRCGPCQSTADQQRGTTTERGYGSAWAKLSAAVQRRDGYQCRIRLPGCTDRSTTADHIVPKALGGSDDPSNLQAACRHCNSAKRDRLV